MLEPENEGEDEGCAACHRYFLGRCQWGARVIDFDADLHIAYLKKFNIEIDLG